MLIIPNMPNIPLRILNLRSKKETAIAVGDQFLNLSPDFQREYEAWDDKLKTRFIETMLIGRSMNPIWTIANIVENTEEVLDGMHRTKTALNFLNNEFKLCGKFFSDSKFDKYDKKFFQELDPDDQNKIRNYEFSFNQLDSSYRNDIKKLKDMYEILNRSSRTLNDYEFNKVIYNSYYTILQSHKECLNEFFKKSDKRGDIETEIIDLIVLSNELPTSWGSTSDLRNNYLKNNLGESKDSVELYLTENMEIIKCKLELFNKIIQYLTEDNFFDEEKKIFNKNYIPYKFLLGRLVNKLTNYQNFNRYISDILLDFTIQVIHVDIQEELECKSRNALFQRKLINLIDYIIDSNYDPKDRKNRRLFNDSEKKDKLEIQNYNCNICKKNLRNIRYEADHIKPWCQGGDTLPNNLQILCIQCHQNK
jgi:hypothetical protein